MVRGLRRSNGHDPRRFDDNLEELSEKGGSGSGSGGGTVCEGEPYKPPEGWLTIAECPEGRLVTIKLVRN